MRNTSTKRRTNRPTNPDELLPEYDFSQGAPNKFASLYKPGSSVVVLDPDVTAAFPTAEAANEALRALAGIIQKHAPSRLPSRRTTKK